MNTPRGVPYQRSALSADYSTKVSMFTHYEDMEDDEKCNKKLCYGRGTALQLVSRNSVTTKHPI